MRDDVYIFNGEVYASHSAAKKAAEKWIDDSLTRGQSVTVDWTAVGSDRKAWRGTAKVGPLTVTVEVEEKKVQS